MRKSTNDNDPEKRMAEEIWMNYFNRYLFDDGIISEYEYKMMIDKISAKNSGSMSVKFRHLR